VDVRSTGCEYAYFWRAVLIGLWASLDLFSRSCMTKIGHKSALLEWVAFDYNKSTVSENIRVGGMPVCVNVDPHDLRNCTTG
jgi:hypothetical protein